MTISNDTFSDLTNYVKEQAKITKKLVAHIREDIAYQTSISSMERHAVVKSEFSARRKAAIAAGEKFTETPSIEVIRAFFYNRD